MKFSPPSGAKVKSWKCTPSPTCALGSATQERNRGEKISKQTGRKGEDRQTEKGNTSLNYILALLYNHQIPIGSFKNVGRTEPNLITVHNSDSHIKVVTKGKKWKSV